MKRKTIMLVVFFQKKLWVAAGVLIALVTLCGAVSLHMYNEGLYPLKGQCILVDPGHGGIDGGASYQTLLEKDLNLKLGIKLRDTLLEKESVPMLTREADISLDDRNQISTSRHKRDLYARVQQINSGNVKAFVSIHTNQTSNSRSAGPLVFYSDRVTENKILAETIQNKLNDAVSQYLHANRVNRLPVLASDLYLLAHADVPGVLVEAGFLSSPVDRDLLQREDYRGCLSTAITSGLEEYFRLGLQPSPPQKTAAEDDLLFPELEEAPVIKIEDYTIAKGGK